MLARYSCKFEFGYSGEVHEGQLTIWKHNKLTSTHEYSLLPFEDDTIGISMDEMDAGEYTVIKNWKGAQVDIITSEPCGVVSIWDAKEMPLPAPCPPVDFSLFPFCEEWETTVSAPAIAA